MQFVQYQDFMQSVRCLFQKAGAFQKAAENVQKIWGRAKMGIPEDEVFQGVSVTNHGETRLAHCVKYELANSARLVTVKNNGICMFLYAGDHNAVDKWLDRNRGMDFIARNIGNDVLVEPVRTSEGVQYQSRLLKTEAEEKYSDLSVGPLINLLSDRYVNTVIDGLDNELVSDISNIESIASDADIENISIRVSDFKRAELLLDVLVHLRSGDLLAAKTRIDLFRNDAKRISDLAPMEVGAIRSSETVVKVSDVDPELFDHFVRTANFHSWMLYLHPDQRIYANKDYSGPARLAGVSGSGKTCVIIHRALYLAQKYPDQKILILTLNSALAKLIDELISASRGKNRPENIRVIAFWAFCREKLLDFDSGRVNYYTPITIATNPYATSEHIDEIWSEFYNCDNNNADANAMLPLHRSLLVRGVFPQDYIRQEFDYIRSALAPSERQQYLSLERSGRVIPLLDAYRHQILDGLAGWEKKMEAVGAIDDIGIVSALYHHLDKILAEYRCVLVDEVQDFGTLEMKIIRKIVSEAENDIFLCGDAAQSVYTKRHEAKEAGIELHGRYSNLKKNYRNSRQILEAAHSVLTLNYEHTSKSLVDLEILSPEYANFTSPKPMLLRANSILDELRYSLGYVDWIFSENTRAQKVCIALCGYSQHSIELLGKMLNLPTLSGNCDITGGSLFLSDLEQTKGFEFDSMFILNCSSKTIPHPDLPAEESYRDLSRLYVAMTRAKLELVISYSGEVSSFIALSSGKFNSFEYSDYASPKDIGDLTLPPPSLSEKLDKATWFVKGEKFLKLRDAVGLPDNLQQELLDHVTGSERTVGHAGKIRRQTEWKTFIRFYEAMNLGPRSRNQIISEDAWGSLQARYGPAIY